MVALESVRISTEILGGAVNRAAKTAAVSALVDEGK